VVSRATLANDAPTNDAHELPSVRYVGFAGSRGHRGQRLGTYPNFLRASLKNLRPWRIAFMAYLVGLAFVGFWPAPVDKPISHTLTAALKYLHGLGMPGWLDYHFVEASANVAMFIPLGIVAAKALPNKPWWQLAAIGLMASVCMELGQLLFFTARFSSLTDIVTNTFGGVVGIMSARLVPQTGAQKWAAR